MGFDSELKRSSNPQKNSQVVGKERAQLPQENLRQKNQGKLKVGNDIALPPGKDQINGTLGQRKKGDCSGQPLKDKPAKEDELVRYMSNLPGYLQHVDSGVNLKEKALHVGVLDWARLEKWKYHRKRITTLSGNDQLSTSTMSLLRTNSKSSALASTVSKYASANKSKPHSSTCSRVISHKNELPRGAKPSIQKVRHFQDIETASKSTLDRQKKPPKTYKSFGETYSDAMPDKGKKKDLDQKITSEMGNMSSNMRYHGVSPPPKETESACVGGAKNRIEEEQELDVNEEYLDQKQMEASLSKSRNNAVSLGSWKMLRAEEDNKTKKKETQGSEIDLTPQCSPGEHKNIVLPRSARNSFSEELHLSDGKLNEANSNSVSSDLFHKVHSGELCHEVSHSCPLPSGLEMNPEADTMVHGLEPSSDAFHGSACPKNTGSIRSQGKYMVQDEKKSQDADDDCLKILEEEMAELANSRSRAASPNRRFSFSLSRMTRSFSFKEGSSIPPLSSNYVSARSGPVRFDSSDFSDDAKREKVNGHNRTRSSPLRRMLDPLLKSKGSSRFADTVRPSKGSLNSSTAQPKDANKLLQEEKFEQSTVQALLQVTVKNGLPVFRFVVENGSNMLATTLKSLASSAKGGVEQNYLFSSVTEIKKRSGSWISQGNKEKSCGVIYNIIGQMKISNSHISDLTAKGYCNQYQVRESVLFGVEQGQADQASGNFTPKTELAAVVIKMPGESNDVLQGDRELMKGFTECSATDGCTSNTMENASFNSISAILPGGVHSVPNRGTPSSLIERWKSGGLCDCGGWDVGCKLQILSNQCSRCCNILRTFQACLDPNRLELYAQGEASQNQPIFSLVPHKNGIYQVMFSSSITALQAFSISVTVINCQKTIDLPEFGNLLEGKVMKETTLSDCFGLENKTTINVPAAKYAPIPPHSPVGRV